MAFSPYLTCIVGGRGTGKSTLLNVIHEKVRPGDNRFFREARLSPEKAKIHTAVSIDGDTEKKDIEFFGQNEIESFASNPERLTAAIFARIEKLQAEVNRDRTKSEVVVGLWLDITSAISNGAKNLDPTIDRLERIMKIFGVARDDGATAC